jgi:hypothetical protein
LIEYCRKVLIQNAGQWNIPTGAEWRVLVSNNYQPNYGTLALFWFHNGAEFPQAVTKVFRSPEIPAREFESLKKVHAVAPSLVPRPFHVGEGREFWMLWMEGVEGQQFRAKRDASAARLGSVIEALMSIHRTAKAATPAPERLRRLVLDPLAALEQFGQAESVRTACARLRAQCSNDWVTSLPVIPQHGDFFINNLFLHREQLRVLDWESYGIVDLPFYDLFTFLISLLGWEAVPGKWDAKVAGQLPGLIEQYSSGLGLARPDVSVFLPLCLANSFHLHWIDGRRDFSTRMYQLVCDYLEHAERWQEMFCRR